MSRARDRADAGFSLLEVLIAAMVLTMLALAVFSSFSVAYSADRTSQQLVSARSLAQQTMETVASTPFPQTLALDRTSVSQGDFTAQILVTQIGNGLVRAEVLVTHAENEEVNLRFTTALADAG